MTKIKKSATVDKTLAIFKAKAEARKKRKLKPKPIVKPKPVVKLKPITPEPPKLSIKKASYGKQDLEHFKQIIVDKKKEILEELESLRDTMMDSTTGEYASESSTYSTHMEQGTDSMEREKTFLFASREGKFLNHLEDALQRIEKGTYGRCSECGKLIEKERLEAVPHAQQCLQCKLRRGR
jgi:DnaK suppressor protein